jgi:flavin reductase (DIM6/NTAB) family NADH-FMN oxidoreductase RutF
MFKKITPEEISFNPFKLVGDDWMLITAGDEKKANTMTASWGGFGVIWEKNAAFCFIRKSRYTKEFVDAQGDYSLCFFDPKIYRKQLAYLGSVSGRKEDKIKKSGLTLNYENGVPFFAEAKTVFICHKMASQFLSPDNFKEAWINEDFYKDSDYHTEYIGEIKEVLVKE